MSRKMFAYIQEEALCVHRLIEERKRMAAPFVERFAHRPFDRIFILGSGSSRNAALIAQPFMEKMLKIETTVQMPSRSNGLDSIAGKDSLLILVSQGGHSTNTLAAAKRFGVPTEDILAITEDEASPIAQAAGLHIRLPWESPETVGAKTKGVTCSSAILMLLALELALATGKIGKGTYDAVVAAFGRFVESHAENVRRVAEWVARNAAELMSMPDLLILAQGEFLGSGMECALKLLETLYRPVTAYEFEEYLHGVANSIDEKNYLLALMPKGEGRERMQTLVDFAAERGSHCFSVYLDAPARGDREVSLISSGCGFVDALNYLLPGQVMSSDLSEACGYDIEKPRFAGFKDLMKTKA